MKTVGKNGDVGASDEVQQDVNNKNKTHRWFIDFISFISSLHSKDNDDYVFRPVHSATNTNWICAANGKPG